MGRITSKKIYSKGAEMIHKNPILLSAAVLTTIEGINITDLYTIKHRSTVI